MGVWTYCMACAQPYERCWCKHPVYQDKYTLDVNDPLNIADIPCVSPLSKQIGGSHYKDMAIQPIVFIMANKLDFPTGNVIKYVCRAAKKGGVEDLEKAQHYLEMLIEDARKAA